MGDQVSGWLRFANLEVYFGHPSLVMRMKFVIMNKYVYLCDALGILYKVNIN